MQNDTLYPHPTPVTLSHNSWGVLVWILFVMFRKGQASSKIAVASVLGLLIMEASRNPGLLKNGKVKSSWDVWSWKKKKIVYALEERQEGVSKIANGTHLPVLPWETGSSHTSGCYGSLAFSCRLMNFLPCDFSFLLCLILWHPFSSTSASRIISPTMPGVLLPLSIIEFSHSLEIWAPSELAKPGN